VYRPRGINELQILFKKYFQSIAEQYESKYAPRCRVPMNVIAVITDPEEVHKILRHLVKVGRSPPGPDPNFA
jgi:hypothetical protein